jgi:hypothetical protein
VIRGTAHDLSLEEIERRVEVRMTRQQLLEGCARPQLWVILDESVIRRVVGGALVMQAQLERLIATCEQGNATVQVVPYRAASHPGLAGPFIILNFDEPAEPDIVYLETVGGNLYVDKTEEARLFATAFDHLRAVALSPADTRGMLRTAAQGLK